MLLLILYPCTPHFPLYRNLPMPYLVDVVDSTHAAYLEVLYKRTLVYQIADVFVEERYMVAVYQERILPKPNTRSMYDH